MAASLDRHFTPQLRRSASSVQIQSEGSLAPLGEMELSQIFNFLSRLPLFTSHEVEPKVLKRMLLQAQVLELEPQLDLDHYLYQKGKQTFFFSILVKGRALKIMDTDLTTEMVPLACIGEEAIFICNLCLSLLGTDNKKLPSRIFNADYGTCTCFDD